MLSDVASLPGVRVAQGTIEDEASLVDKDGETIGRPGQGVSMGVEATDDQSLNPFQLVSGEWPSGDGQIAIDNSTAEKEHFEIGQTVGAYGDGPVKTYEISGIVRFGSEGGLGGITVSVFDLETAQRLFKKEGKFDLISVGAEEGVTEAELSSQIEPLLSETMQVKTAAAQARDDSADTQEGLNIIKYFLLGFGGIALFVGSFVIANTLAITVAQRMRELATLRTLGASRRQVLGSVILESLAIGLVGSVIGLFLGLGIAVGLMSLLESLGIDLPSGGLVFSVRTIVVSLGIGTLIAVLASLRPAMRATRIEPIAAVREGAVMPASRFARYAVPVSAAVGVIAIALFSYGVFASGVDVLVRVIVLVAGVLFMFVAVAMIATRVVRPLAYVLGAPGARFGGTAGSLARQNAVRNPARTASTAAAVMIGLALITFVAVIGQGFKTSFTGAVDELFVADYSVSAGNNGELLTNEAAQAAATAPGVEAVSEMRSGDAKVDGKTVVVTGVDANVTKVINITWASGSSSVPAELGRDGAFLVKRYADDHSLAVGSPLTVETPTGNELQLHVDGIVEPAEGRLAVRRDLGLDRHLRRRLRQPGQRPHPPQHRGRPLGREHRGPGEEPRSLPGRGRRDSRGVQGHANRRDHAVAPDPVRPARPVRDREPLRRHQHARALRLRADARAGDAAGDRDDPQAGAADDPAREHRHGVDRCRARDRSRPLPRRAHDRRALPVRDRVRGAGRDARRLRRRRDPRGDARGDPAGAACVEAERARGTPI